MSADDTSNDAKKRPPGDRPKSGHTDKSSNKQSEANVVRNIQAIVDLERKLSDDRKQVSRISEVFSKMAASPAFIAGHLIVFAAWIILNATRMSLDPRPFNLLNLALTFEAIILTSVVLIAQRDLRRLADRRAHLDLQVNILAEQELTAILGLLNQVCAKLGIDPRKTEPDVEHLAKDTDVRTIAKALDQNLDE
jgi:uncharacterized membrane protein